MPDDEIRAIDGDDVEGHVKYRKPTTEDAGDAAGAEGHRWEPHTAEQAERASAPAPTPLPVADDDAEGHRWEPHTPEQAEQASAPAPRPRPAADDDDAEGHRFLS
jgi:hypothetical protein